MIVAVDIGGTKTIVAGFDSSGKMISEERVSTAKDTEEFSATLLSLLERFPANEVEAISAAAPGLIDIDAGVVVYSPNLKWENYPIREILSKRFSCPIYLGNDAHIAGIGATHALDDIPELSLYISVGTGIGIGIISNGKIDPAFSRSEAGHMVFQTENGLQTWEEFASGRAITKRFGRLAAELQDEAEWQIIADQLAVGLRVLIPALQPDIVIVGGGIGAHLEHFENPLIKALQTQLREPKLIKLPPIIKAIDPEKAVIHGCYYHALTQTTSPRP